MVHNCAFDCVCPAFEPLVLLMTKFANFLRRIVTGGFCEDDQGLQTVDCWFRGFLSLLNESGFFVRRRYIALSNRECDRLSQQYRLFRKSIIFAIVISCLVIAGLGM